MNWQELLLLVGAWVGFALFGIACSTLVALHADRLAHRQYQVVRTMFFEHVLQLPLSYHTGSHSGRLMKVMITGTNTLWGTWLSFFRENFASFVSLFLLLPLLLFMNWRYGLLLIVLCGVFALLIALVVNRSQTLQSKVEGYYSDVAERTIRHARQHRAGAELRPHRIGSGGHEEAGRPGAGRPAAGARPGGRWPP